MDINKKSWHYRLINEIAYVPPTNLCPYIRKLTGILIITAAGLIMVAVCIGGLLAPIVNLLPWFHIGMLEDSLNGGLLKLGILEYLILLGYVLYQVSNHLYKALKQYKAYNYTSTKSKKEKTPNIFWEWIKAKHNKMCPTLTFTSDE